MSVDEQDDGGFGEVLAGNVYVPPEVTATVSEQAETPATEQQVSDAGKALIGPLPANFDQVQMSKLAREVAMDIKERHAILKEFGLTEVQYEWLAEHNPIFKNALTTAIREWQSPLSTKERVSIAAAAILEDSLPVLGSRMQNRGEGLPGVIEAAKFFGKLSGIGEREHSSAPVGERFVINIDLGGDQKVTLQAGDAPQVSEPTVRLPYTPATGQEARAGEVLREPEATSLQAPVQHKPEGT